MIVAGVDIGKDRLDVHVLEGAEDRRFPNTKKGQLALRDWLLERGVARVVPEPTGRHRRLLHQRLWDAGFKTVLVNPLRSRRFAEAVGRLAKNDRVDAAMLAGFGLVAGVETKEPKAGALQQLGDILVLRRKLVEQRTALRALQGEVDPDAAGCGDAVLDAMESGIANCERRAAECIASDPGLARRAEIIQSVPGLGAVNAASLLADMPELGRIGRRQAASLIGVAPFDDDSGKRSGRRSIQGGRARPRHLLYMAALSAVRWEPGCWAMYRRLVDTRGKEPKVAMVAVMRKLVGVLGALLRDDRLWQPEPPARPLQAAS